MVNNRDVSEDVLKILEKASVIYNILKEYQIRIDLDCNGYVNILSSEINNNDKKILSIFLSFFFVDCDTKKMLKDYNVDLGNVLDLIYDGNSNKLFNDYELRNLIYIAEQNDVENDSDIETIVKQMSEDYAYLSAERLLVLLYESSYSGSRLINLFLPCVLESCSPFSDAKSLYELFSRRATEIEREKMEKDPYIKEKDNNLNEKYSNGFFSILGLNHKKENKSDNITKNGEYLTDITFDSNPAIGREKELEKAKVSLLTKDKSLILVGPGGVGKTAIVEGIAYDIQKGNVPNKLKEKKIFSLNTADLVSGCKYVGTFEEKVEKIFDKIIDDGDTIVFIDEIHTVFGLGAGSNSTLDFANILKSYLSRGKIQIIGATTNEEYDNIVARDLAFKRRFERLDVKEPIADLLLRIMNEVIKKYEKNYNIKFLSNDAEKAFVLKQVVSVTEQAKRIYSDKGSNPDLAILILEKAFAYALYNSHQIVTREDIVTSIMDCDRIYESVREEAKDTIQRRLQDRDIKEKVKIISFDNYRNKTI